MSFNLEKLIRPNIATMNAYSSARKEFEGAASIFLDANESPFDNGINRYPPSDPLPIRKALAEEKGLSPLQIALGNGSDEIIDLLMRAFARPGTDKVASLEPSYGMYPITAALNDLSYVGVKSGADFNLNQAQLKEFLKIENLSLIFLCSPNNPTGNNLDRGAIELLLNKFSGLVIVDEAYIDFCPEKSLIDWLDQYPNLVIIQTFSKARGAAGIRMGMMYASQEIVAIIQKIKPPYNLSSLSQAEALKLLASNAWKAKRQQIIAERERLSKTLTELEYVEQVFPSEANFVLFTSSKASQLFQYLKSLGIIIRDRQNQIDQALRISIGSPLQMDQLIKALKEFA